MKDPLHSQKSILILNSKLIAPNASFVHHNDTGVTSLFEEISWFQPDSGKIWKLRWKIIDSKL